MKKKGFGISKNLTLKKLQDEYEYLKKFSEDDLPEDVDYESMIDANFNCSRLRLIISCSNQIEYDIIRGMLGLKTKKIVYSFEECANCKYQK